ncbi:MAG: 1-deoxy-D-xylulose-5-phosphate reductoisomerase, partial [Candidatus Omnitrophica bacterium]|nr:1-deoxy-D-xylulose-5-phosphate reductoisomerase [Candidatus Omnitrophota bacterium]
MRPKRIAILGSTGSIGVNTLKVIGRYPRRFIVTALSAYTNTVLLQKQVRQFAPKHVAAAPRTLAGLKRSVPSSTRLYDAETDLGAMAALKEVDVVVIAMRGAGALAPFLAAARAGKTIAPANKEALVMAGEILMKEAHRFGARIIPVDSEQSAIFQCLDGAKTPVKSVHLTASGGPLRDVPASRFGAMTVKDILRHPRWNMGPKITVDSATLMNKGFEFIEAQRLFGLRFDQIKVVVHPQAIIHSMVEFEDGSILAQLGVTDMRLPIQYALTYPDRLPTGLGRLDLAGLKQLNFQKPDLKKFPALGLAFEAARSGGTLPCVLNAANEEAVEGFLKGKIGFTAIYKVVEKIVRRHKIIASATV